MERMLWDSSEKDGVCWVNLSPSLQGDQEFHTRSQNIHCPKAGLPLGAGRAPRLGWCRGRISVLGQTN